MNQRWRTFVVFRFVSLAGLLAQLLRDGRHHEHQTLAWVLFACVFGWSVATAWGYPRIHRGARALLILDVCVTLAAMRAGHEIEGPDADATDIPRLTGWWPASVVVAWSLAGGWRWGALAGVFLGAAGIKVGDGLDNTLAGTGLMLLAALAVGFSDRRRLAAEQRLRESMRREAAVRERERLACDIHDSVLQVLALIARRGAELGGEAAELGRLAGGQERVLRQVIVAPRGVPADGRQELCRALRRCADRPGVFVTDTGTEVWLPAETVRELQAAVDSALDNVVVHCGPDTHAWILVEAEPELVRVSIQDNGPGMPPHRLAQADAEGRLGIARSIRGRVHALGGAVDIASAPGQGTRVELSVPRAEAVR